VLSEALLIFKQVLVAASAVSNTADDVKAVPQTVLIHVLFRISPRFRKKNSEKNLGNYFMVHMG
jgi:hypothetical protein